MDQRKISRADIELVLHQGDGWIDDDELWICELGHVRVIVREEAGTGVIITVIRLKGGER